MYTFASLGNNMVRNYESIAPDANRLNYVLVDGPAKELALVFLE
jgi:hypothetical protein